MRLPNGFSGLFSLRHPWPPHVATRAALKFDIRSRDAPTPIAAKVATTKARGLPETSQADEHVNAEEGLNKRVGRMDGMK